MAVQPFKMVDPTKMWTPKSLDAAAAVLISEKMPRRDENGQYIFEEEHLQIADTLNTRTLLGDQTALGSSASPTVANTAMKYKQYSGLNNFSQNFYEEDVSDNPMSEFEYQNNLLNAYINDRASKAAEKGKSVNPQDIANKFFAARNWIQTTYLPMLQESGSYGVGPTASATHFYHPGVSEKTDLQGQANQQGHYVFGPGDSNEGRGSYSATKKNINRLGAYGDIDYGSMPVPQIMGYPGEQADYAKNYVANEKKEGNYVFTPDSQEAPPKPGNWLTDSIDSAVDEFVPKDNNEVASMVFDIVQAKNKPVPGYNVPLPSKDKPSAAEIEAVEDQGSSVAQTALEKLENISPANQRKLDEMLAKGGRMYAKRGTHKVPEIQNYSKGVLNASRGYIPQVYPYKKPKIYPDQQMISTDRRFHPSDDLAMGKFTTDTIPAMLTPGEAVIPAEAAQNPKNQPIIKEMIEEGREEQDAKKKVQWMDLTNPVNAALYPPSAGYGLNHEAPPPVNEGTVVLDGPNINTNPRANPNAIVNIGDTASSVYDSIASVGNTAWNAVKGEPYTGGNEYGNNVPPLFLPNPNALNRITPSVGGNAALVIPDGNQSQHAIRIAQAQGLPVENSLESLTAGFQSPANVAELTPSAVPTLTQKELTEEEPVVLAEATDTPYDGNKWNVIKQTVTQQENDDISNGEASVPDNTFTKEQVEQLLKDLENRITVKDGEVKADGETDSEATGAWKWLEDTLGFTKRDAMRGLLYYFGSRVAGYDHRVSMTFAGKRVLAEYDARAAMDWEKEKFDKTEKGKLARKEMDLAQAAMSKTLTRFNKRFEKEYDQFTPEGQALISRLITSGDVASLERVFHPDTTEGAELRSLWGMSVKPGEAPKAYKEIGGDNITPINLYTGNQGQLFRKYGYDDEGDVIFEEVDANAYVPWNVDADRLDTRMIRESFNDWTSGVNEEEKKAKTDKIKKVFGENFDKLDFVTAVKDYSRKYNKPAAEIGYAVSRLFDYLDSFPEDKNWKSKDIRSALAMLELDKDKEPNFEKLEGVNEPYIDSVVNTMGGTRGGREMLTRVLQDTDNLMNIKDSTGKIIKALSVEDLGKPFGGTKKTLIELTLNEITTKDNDMVGGLIKDSRARHGNNRLMISESMAAEIRKQPNPYWQFVMLNYYSNPAYRRQ